MKLLLDRGIPLSTSKLLKGQSLDAIHISDLGYARADDRQITELARIEERTIVTLDADYHAAIALTSASSPSVIWIRIAKLRAAEYTAIVASTVDEYKERLLTGVLITIQSDRTIRLRSLPINLKD